MDRPLIVDISDPADFRDWYWLKAEMVRFARLHNLPIAGNKADLRERILHYLENGTIARSPKPARAINSAHWSKAELFPQTVITEDISFGPNVRGFFKAKIGKTFSCTSEFMDWVKQNPGQTLADAVNYWRYLEARKKDPGFKREIAPENQYNRYVRAFFLDNPDATMKAARACWLAKSRRPGKPVYEPSDLSLI